MPKKLIVSIYGGAVEDIDLPEVGGGGAPAPAAGAMPMAAPVPAAPAAPMGAEPAAGGTV
jgi:hypothetical protein